MHAWHLEGGPASPVPDARLSPPSRPAQGTPFIASAQELDPRDRFPVSRPQTLISSPYLSQTSPMPCLPPWKVQVLSIEAREFPQGGGNRNPDTEPRGQCPAPRKQRRTHMTGAHQLLRETQADENRTLCLRSKSNEESANLTTLGRNEPRDAHGPGWQGHDGDT